MLKTSLQLAGALPATAIDNSKAIRSSVGNYRKSTKSDFTKLMCGAEELSFLTPNARQAFTQLRKAFTEAPILWYFNSEHYIRIETDSSSYAIGDVFSQITSETGQWHLVAYYSQKMISAKTLYETHNNKLLAILKAFKYWRYYLEGC